MKQLHKLRILILKIFKILKWLIVVIFLVALFIYIWREVARDTLIIEPFTVPRRFEEAGLTPEAMANRIGEALRQIEINTQTEMQKDNLIWPHDKESKLDDVEIPGANVHLKAIVEVIRAVVGRHSEHASGDIVAFPNAKPPAANPQVTVTVYIVRGRNENRAITRAVDTENIDVLAKDTAEIILGEVNPYFLAAYRYDRGEIEQAAELLQRIVRDPSEDRGHKAPALNLLGLILFDQRKYDEAVIKYQKAIELDPEHASPAYNNWGLLLNDQNKYDEAAARYRKAIELDPKYAPTYGNLGLVLYVQERYNEAAAMYRKAIELDPKDPDAYRDLGDVLEAQEKYDEAVAQYKKAIDLNPEDATAYNNWGLVLYDQKKYDEAAATYRKAIETDPKNTDAYNNWGNSLRDQKKYAEAIAKYKKAIEIDPKNADAYNNWGDVLRDQKKYAEAEIKFAKARELSQ